MPKMIIELEIEGLEADATSVIDELLDSGLLQDAINDHEFDAGPLLVKSALVRPAPKL